MHVLSNAHHTPDNAVGSACIARSHEAVIRVYDSAAKVIERHEHKGDFKESHGKGFYEHQSRTGVGWYIPSRLQLCVREHHGWMRPTHFRKIKGSIIYSAGSHDFCFVR